MKIIGDLNSKIEVTYDSSEERNADIKERCLNGYVCTEIYGTRVLKAKFKKESIC